MEHFTQKSVRDFLLQEADTQYAQFALSLVPQMSRSLLGVRIPVLRKLARKIAKGNWREWMDEASDETFEEVLLQGLVIGSARMSYSEAVSRMHAYARKIDNWSLCDSACNSFRFVREAPEQSWDILQPYCFSGDEFLQRFGVVMLLCHFINETYIERVLSTLASVRPVGYYDRMAVAWTVSVCFVKFPILTEELLRSDLLDDETHRKSVQKICESRCVRREDKKRCRLYRMCRTKS